MTDRLSGTANIYYSYLGYYYGAGLFVLRNNDPKDDDTAAALPTA